MSTQTTETTAIPVSTNPFPGLRPFDFDESHLFFGRDGQSEQLIAKLARTRFLAVVGTSGSGKSSLVRAGFLPALQGGFMSSAGSSWRVATLRPGNDPIGNLAQALNEPDVFGSEFQENRAIQTAIAESTLRRGSLGLVDTARQAVMSENENLLVVVDQFEEIFRFARVTEGQQYGNEAAAFIKLLLEAAGQRDVAIYVVLTMRSDYLGDCSQFWGLPEAINESQYLIPRLTRDQLREAITGPVAVGGGEIRPRLVNRLLNDVGDNQDQLPVLQHLLMRAWAEWTDQKLTVSVKEGDQIVTRSHKEVHEGNAIDLCCADAVGGMAEALSRHADEAYSDLPNDHHRDVAEKLFKALTEKGADNREIRRPITLGEICAVTEADKSEVSTVVETFRRPGRSFLMPPASVALGPESLIDISHESLIRGWMRLKDWVDEEARSARIYRRLAETAVLYKEGNAGLWRDPDLQIALAWREQSKPNEIWAKRYHPEFVAAQAFLDESLKARNAQAVLDESRRKKEIRRTRLTALIFAVAFLFSLVMGVYAFGAKNDALKQKAAADAARTGALAEKQKADVARNEALAEKHKADDARDDALGQKTKADEATEAALAEKRKADEATKAVLIQKRKADDATTDALGQKKEALEQRDVATAEAMKGRALGALKEKDPNEAIRIFGLLAALYRIKQDHAGETYALASIGDIHRDQAPLAVFNMIANDSDFPDGDESLAMKQYYMAVSAMALSDFQDDDKLKESLLREAAEAVKSYDAALITNQQSNSDRDHFVRKAYVLRNLGDLHVNMAEFSLERMSDREKAAGVMQIQEGVHKGVDSYRGAREAYKAAGLQTEEGEMLKLIGESLFRNASRLEKVAPKETDQAQVRQSSSDYSELQKAVKVLEEASKVFEAAGKPLLQAGVLARLGDIFRRVAVELPEAQRIAIDYYDQAQKLFAKNEDFRREAIIDEQLAKLHENDDDGEEIAAYKAAFMAYRRALIDPKGKSDNLEKGDAALARVGSLLFKLDRKPEAKNFFEEAVRFSSSDVAVEARTLAAIANFYKQKGDVATALSYYDRKRKVWSDARKFYEEGNTSFEMGMLQVERDKNLAAISFEAAREAYRRRGEKPNPTEDSARSRNLRDIANFYAERDKEKAIATYDEALQLELAQEVSFTIPDIVKSEGVLLLGLNTAEGRTRAKQLFQKVIDYYRGQNNPYGEASILSSIGNMYKSSGDFGEARPNFERARSIYLTKKERSSLLAVVKQLGEIELADHPGSTLVDYYLREAESARHKNEPFAAGMYLEAAAKESAANKEKQKAIEYYEMARVVYHTARLKEEISVLRDMAAVYADLGDAAKATELKKLADDLSRPSN
jgi:energy-coupling factor transporter ATP-binding protein EcfA2